MTALPKTPEGLTLTNVGNDETGMFRSAFGEPKPRTEAQLVEAMLEMDVMVSDVYEIAITDSTSEPEDTVWHGWTAEIRSEPDNDYGGDASWISTGGWPSREALVADLKKVGFDDDIIVDEEW